MCVCVCTHKQTITRTALTAVYVHHIGTRVSIPHTYTNTICGGGTYCNPDRGAKMPSGSAAILLLLRYRYLHTRAAGGEHKCLLLPVPACWRACLPANAFRYPYTHPHIHTHLQSPITSEECMFESDYIYINKVCVHIPQLE